MWATVRVYTYTYGTLGEVRSHHRTTHFTNNPVRASFDHAAWSRPSCACTPFISRQSPSARPNWRILKNQLNRLSTHTEEGTAVTTELAFKVAQAPGARHQESEGTPAVENERRERDVWLHGR